MHRLCIECSLARELRREWVLKVGNYQTAKRKQVLKVGKPSEGWYASAINLHCSIDIGWENVRILDRP